jgi:hypothetical protein
MRERPVSVTIFGILNIGFGAFALLGLLSQGAMDSFATQSSNPSFSSVLAVLDEMNKNPNYLLWKHISTPLAAVGAVALLASGIGLMMLKNWGRITSIVYGICKIIFDLTNVIVLYLVLGDTIMKAFQKLPSIVLPLVACFAVVGILLSLTYPALLLFFLTRPKCVAAFQAQPPVALPL